MAFFFELRLSQAALFLVVLGFCYAVTLGIYRVYFHPLAKYPGPFLAKLTDWYSAYHNILNDVHIDVLRCHMQYGDFVRYGPNKVISNSVTGFKNIYAHDKNTMKSKPYHALRFQVDVSSTLSASDKKIHGRKRRIIAQGFTETAVRGYEPTIQSKIKLFCEKLVEDESRQGNLPTSPREWSSPKNMAEWVSYLSFDIMTSVTYSSSLELMGRPDNRFIVHAISSMMHGVGVMSQIPHLMKWRRFLVPRSRRAANKFRNVTVKIAMSRMKLALSGNHRDVFNNVLEAKDPETGKGMDMPELLAETALLTVAGSDTTSSGLAAIFFYLSRYPEVLRKLTDEVRSTFDDVEDIRSGPQLRSCIWLRACIDEALRLSPPVSSPVWREVQEGGADIDGEHIAQGYSVGTGLYSLFHNPAYFPSPYRFYPERWIPSDHTSEASVELAKKAFAPFLAGSRMCAAKNMAMAELLMTVAYVVWSLDFKIADGPTGKLGAGEVGMGTGRERDDEFQIKAYFVTVASDGPVLQFRKRQ